MNSELRNSIRRIRESTDIELSVFTPEGKCLTGPAPAPGAPPDGIAQDRERGYTYFRASCKSGEYVCALAGTGKVQKNYAVLLADLLENAGNRVLSLSKNEFTRQILLGECGAADVRKYCAKYAVPDLPCCAMAVSAKGDAADVVNLLSQYAENGADCAVPVGGGDCAFIRFMNEESEYPSAADFATFLSRSLWEELGVESHIGVGGVFRRFEDIGKSYQQASAALRLSAVLHSKGSVHSYREFVLMKMLEDIPDNKLAEYLSILLDGSAKELLKDEDMVNTAEEFLENNLNVSETSRNLYMHRNTLMYRLDKIERVTGLNLRKFSDAVTFRVITILNRLV